MPEPVIQLENQLNIDLFSQPQFDWKYVKHFPESSGSVPPNSFFLKLVPQFFHRRLYIHCAERWLINILFKLGGMPMFQIGWQSRTFPGPSQSGEMRFSFLNDLAGGKNVMTYSHPSDGKTYMRPFYLTGQWDEVFVQTVGVESSNQSWFFGIFSQSHW